MNKNRKRYSECTICGKAILKKGSKYCKSCLGGIQKSKRTVIKCLVCGEEKEYAEWETKKGRKYCSTECFHKVHKVMKWTDEEKRILREYYADTPKGEIVRLLPRKSYGAISRLASTHGLRKSKVAIAKSYKDRTIRYGQKVRNKSNNRKNIKPRTTWTKEEENILISNYESCTFEKTSELLSNKSHSSIRTKASKLGLKKGFNPWNKNLTKETDLRLRKISEDRKGQNNPVFNPGVRERIAETLRGRFLGELNPSWIDGRSYDRYVPEFYSMRDEIRERDNYQCSICGVPERECSKQLEVHHIDGQRKNNCETNLITLCKTCHLRTRKDRDFWEIILSNLAQERSSKWSKKKFKTLTTRRK